MHQSGRSACKRGVGIIAIREYLCSGIKYPDTKGTEVGLPHELCFAGADVQSSIPGGPRTSAGSRYFHWSSYISPNRTFSTDTLVSTCKHVIWHPGALLSPLRIGLLARIRVSFWRVEFHATSCHYQGILASLFTDRRFVKMAPMKRQRPALDDGSGEVIEVDNVSSNLQQASVSQVTGLYSQ